MNSYGLKQTNTRGKVKLGLLALLMGLFMIVYSSPPDDYDVLIKNAEIVDGTGKPAFRGNVALKGEKIVAVGKTNGQAAIVIDGSGLVASPGFIDPHSHADTTILRYPLAENLVMQGITTFLGGNCGASPAPLKNLSFGDFLSKVEGQGLSINYAPLVGHNTVRSTVMGEDFKRKATAEEIQRMKTYVEEAMKSGAFGFSTFTDPSPGEYADVGEIIELAKVAQKYGGRYIPHTRHIQSQMPSNDLKEYGYGIYHGPMEDVWVGRYRGYLEALEISRRANIPLHIAHMSNAFIIPQPHPDLLDKAAAEATLIEVIDKARQQGLSVTFDVISSSSTIAGRSPLIEEFFSPRLLYPEWLKKLKKEEFTDKLKTKEFRSALRSLYDSGKIKFGMIHTKADPYWMDCFKILSCKKTEYQGKTVGEIADLRKTDPFETILDLLVEDPKTMWVQFLDRRFMPEAIPVFLKSPYAMPCTDVSALPAKGGTGEAQQAPPIAYGMFPHYLGTYVRETHVLSLEDAVKKATSFPAQMLGLKDRGILAPGAYADVVVFNLKTIRMVGDFLNPSLPPEGIEYVIVNGRVVYKEKTHTGEKPGKIIRHKS